MQRLFSYKVFPAGAAFSLRCKCRLGSRLLALGFPHGRRASSSCRVMRESCVAENACNPLIQQRRLQSATADKRFHCSVCNKAFRLEMAAKVHLQQAHNGEGSVEVGAGPGQPNSSSAEAWPTVPPANAPPQGPTVIEEVIKEDRPLRRRSKPTPKPLHEPYRDVPSDVLEEMLEVWDAVGVKRLQGRFVHSSMVMKVFAANPDAGPEPLYDPMEPEGENPFANVTAKADTPATVDSEEHNIYDIDLNDAFALATEEHYGPFRVARCENPFLKAAQGAAAGSAARLRVQASLKVSTGPAATAPVEDGPQTAPVTPYGQLPLFGQEPLIAATPAAASAPAGVVASPFSATMTDSPFAQHVTSPFVASPFPASPSAADGVTSSPFPDSLGRSEVPSPFVGLGVDSPFSSSAAPSPFTASPFVDSASGASATAVATGLGGAGSFTGATSFPPYQVPDGGFGSAFPDVDAGTGSEIVEPAHECPSCGKTFLTHEGMRMHAMAKHGVELPPQKKPNKTPRGVPELPAYIPSPVDLSMTEPFGKATNETSWTETEIVPHAVSVSNITITGKVLDVESLDASTVQITVFVPGERKEDSETLTVRWVDPSASLSRNDTVFVSGTLRLLPIYEAVVDKYYSSPVIFAAKPTGLVQKIY